MSKSNIKPAIQLDALGMLCPEPVIRASHILRDLKPGEVLQVDADDPLAELDFRVFCERTGHELLVPEPPGNSVQRFLIRCRGDRD